MPSKEVEQPPGEIGSVRKASSVRKAGSVRKEGKRQPGRPRNLPLDEQRRLILESARSVFAEHGYRGATIERVARVAGLARPSVYESFGSKDELWVAAVDDAVETIFNWIGERIFQAGETTMRDRFRLVVSSLFEFMENYPDHASVIRAAQQGHGGLDEVVAGRRLIEDALADLFAAGWEPFDGIPYEVARILAVSSIAMVETIGFRTAAEPKWPAEATIDLLSEILLGGQLRLGRHRELFEGFG